jgi:hypothetical protein
MMEPQRTSGGNGAIVASLSSHSSSSESDNEEEFLFLSGLEWIAHSYVPSDPIHFGMLAMFGAKVRI